MKELVKMKCLWGSNPNGPKTDIGCIGEMIKKSLFYRKHNRYSITFGINHNFDTQIQACTNVNSRVFEVQNFT